MTHYFSKEPFFKKLKIRKITTNLRGLNITLITLPGVFSSVGVDLGTRLLIENMIVQNYWSILDLGCGYGVIGIVAAKLAPNGHVVMTDINKLALKLAKINARLNNVKNVKVRYGNLYEPVRNMKFNTIITNPPWSAGMDINEKLIRESINYLELDGYFQLVVPSKFSKRIAKIIEETYGNLEEIASESRYVVYVARKVVKN